MIDGTKAVVQNQNNVDYYFFKILQLTDQKIASKQAVINAHQEKLKTLDSQQSAIHLLPPSWSKKILFGLERTLGISLGKDLYKRLDSLEKLHHEKARIYEKIDQVRDELRTTNEFRQKTLESTFTLSRWLNTEHREKGTQTSERAERLFKELCATR